ncbi:MAG: lysine biosynthesis protein LysX [Phycisphaerales bacterium]
MRIAMTYTRLRTEERLLLDEYEALGVEVTPVDLRQVVFNPHDPDEWTRFDVVVERSVSLTNARVVARLMESFGVRCVNPFATIELCADKLATSAALVAACVPIPYMRVATSPESGLRGIEQLGYPSVLKPAIGSWGRLIARVNDRDAAEAVLEHRDSLGSVNHSVVYAQEYIEKPGRDLRVFVIGGEPVAAIVRYSDHWVTNTARGARTEGIEITHEIREICVQAAAAMGGDAVAVDLLECPERGLLVNEINHSMEFRNSIDVTGVNIPGLLARHTLEIGAGERA